MHTDFRGSQASLSRPAIRRRGDGKEGGMRKNVDYDLLVRAERIRFSSSFSCSHWLFQTISMYERGMTSKLRREAFESVLRCAINFGVPAAVKLSRTFPDAACFPDFLRLPSAGWKETSKAILGDWKRHEMNRFKYVREGD